MSERPGAITMKGDPLTLLGDEVAVGAAAPGFTVVGNDLSEVSLGDYQGKVCVLVSVPSLDTSVCDKEVRRFNEEAAKLGDDVAVLTISADLPFAQSRWCGAAGIENVQTLSDHRDMAFGEAYGLIIKELRLLARAVHVVDKSGKIVYAELVKEVTEEPDYEAVLDAVRNAA